MMQKKNHKVFFTDDFLIDSCRRRGAMQQFQFVLQEGSLLLRQARHHSVSAPAAHDIFL